MGRLRDNQNGFGAIEVLLLLIFIALVVFIGVYVVHNRNSKPATDNTPAQSTQTQTLTQAVAQAQKVYDIWDKDVAGGQVLKDTSQWAKNNVSAAEDLQFINNNSTWFTPAYITAAEKYRTTATSPPGGGFLVCQNGIAYLDGSSLKVTGDKLSGQTASAKLTYTTGGQGAGGPKKSYTLPLTLKLTIDAWAIDSIDLSSCST